MQTVSGIVEKGEQRGKQLGFPTANIPLGKLDLSGSYVGRVSVDSHLYDAALYADVTREILEAHLLDFDGDLYDKTITVEIIEKIRESAPFVDDEQMSHAIQGDIDRVRGYRAKHKS